MHNRPPCRLARALPSSACEKRPISGCHLWKTALRTVCFACAHAASAYGSAV